jgi:integrase
VTEDVDLKDRVIRVRAKTVDGVFWQPKSKRNRIVPISAALHRILSGHALGRKAVWYFPSPTGCRWDPDNFSQDLRAVNSEAGLPLDMPGLPARVRQSPGAEG